MAVQKGVTYAELTDEIIIDVKAGIEKFVEDEEYWAKFAHKVTVPQGHKEFSFRRLVKPRVREEDVVASAEYIAPRSIKFAVQTFKKTIDIYRFKFKYSKEDLMYHFDDTVVNGRLTLQETVRQNREWILGKAFIRTNAVITYDTSLVKTLDKASIVLRKNDAKRWDGVHWLAHMTPEAYMQLKTEVRALGSSISEETKKDLDKNVLYIWGDWAISISTSEVLYKNDSTQYLVLMGRRGIDGTSPVDYSVMQGGGMEVINNPLGSGVLEDVDGNVTSDDNKQVGSIGINLNGVASAVNDDFAILKCEISVNEIKGTVLDASEKSLYVSNSPASTLAISAVNTSGSAIASPTIVVKKKNSSGTSVSPSDGKYPVVAGDTYYYSVAKTDYTTVLGTIVVNAGANTLVVTLPTA